MMTFARPISFHVDRPGKSTTRRNSGWKKLLAGAVTALLLIPVPAFATLTWGPWNSTALPTDGTTGLPVAGITAWTSSSNASHNTLSIFTASGANVSTTDAITFAFTSLVTQSGNSTDTTSAKATKVTNLTSSTGSFTVQVNPSPNPHNITDYSIFNNQFSSATVNGAPVFLTNISSSTATYTFTVRFTFSAGVSWQSKASPSPFTVSFSDH